MRQMHTNANSHWITLYQKSATSNVFGYWCISNIFQADAANEAIVNEDEDVKEERKKAAQDDAVQVDERKGGDD